MHQIEVFNVIKKKILKKKYISTKPIIVASKREQILVLNVTSLPTHVVQRTRDQERNILTCSYSQRLEETGGGQPLIIIFLLKLKEHGFTFRVDSAVRVEKFKAQVGRRGMQMSTSWGTSGTASVATTISTVFLSLPVNTEFEADAFTFVPPPPICSRAFSSLPFPLTPNNVSLLPFNFPSPSFPTLRVYTSSIPPSTSFYFILTTIKLRDKDGGEREEERRGEERSVEINEFRPVSTSFLRFDCF